jgi:hypothetical protein
MVRRKECEQLLVTSQGSPCVRFPRAAALRRRWRLDFILSLLEARTLSAEISQKI